MFLFENQDNKTSYLQNFETIKDIDKISNDNLCPPAQSDNYLSYNHVETPLNDDFNDAHLEPWTASYTVGTDMSGMGQIYLNDGSVYLKGQVQKVSIPGVGTVPELPDDMAILSGNLVNPNHPWGTGNLVIRFQPNNIVDGWDYYTYNNIPIPFPVYRNFKVQYRTSPTDSFTTLYEYSDESNNIRTESISLSNVYFSSYFEIAIKLYAYDDNDWVSVDYIYIESYSVNIAESIDPIPSNQDMELTVNFLQTHFNLNTNGATIYVFVNPEGEAVDGTCANFTANGDNSNPYTIIIDADLYIQGKVTYKIRFQSIYGHIFWTPTYEFNCYDNDPPVATVIDYNATIGYHEDLVITAHINDTGGSGLGTAKVTWRLNDDPVENDANSVFIESSPNGVDNFIAIFTIPSDNLHFGETLRFRIWVYDRAGNAGNSSICSVNPVDYIPPTLNLWYHSFWSNGTHNILDLGYPLIAKWIINEPNQASGLTDDWDHRFVAIKNGEIEPAHPGDYDIRYDFNSSLSNIYTFEWNHGYPAGSWLYLIVFAQDNNNNEAWEKYKLYVADRRAPDVIEGIGNQNSPIFNEDLSLFFSASEPLGASGVNPASISLRYSINNQGLGAEAVPQEVIGGIYHNQTYTISQIQYKWGDIIYYRYNVSDYSGNLYSTGIRSLTVVDPFLPTIDVASGNDPILSNWSVVYSYFDISLHCNVTDQFSEGGSGIDFVRLYLKNNSQFISFDDVEMWNYYFPLHNDSNYQFFFLIPESDISIDGIVIAIRVYDKAGNYQQWTQTLNVIDNIRPIIRRYNLGTTNEFYLNRLSTDFYFELSTIAFIYYAVDGVKTLTPFTSNNFTVKINFDGEGPHTIMVYFNDYVWVRTVIVDLTNPNPVQSINAELRGLHHYISWNPPEGLEENEVVYYYLYRGTSENFIISEGELVLITNELKYSYKYDKTGTFYYKIVVYDLAMNPSDPSPASNQILMVESKTTALSITSVVIIASVISFTAIVIIRYRKFYGIVRDPTKSKFVALWNKIKAKQYAKKFRERFNFTAKDKVKELNAAKIKPDSIKQTENKVVKPQKAEKYIPIPTALPKELDQVKTRLSPEAQKLLAQNEVKEIDDAIDKVTAVKKKGDDGWMEEVNGSDDGWK